MLEINAQKYLKNEFTHVKLINRQSYIKNVFACILVANF